MNLTADTQYWYRIQACAPGDFSLCAPYPNETTAGNRIATATTATAGTTSLDKPENLDTDPGTGVGNDMGSIIVTWDTETGISYTVQWADNMAMTSPTEVTDNDGTLTQAGLDLATERWYQVRADADSGDDTKTASDWTDAVEGIAGGQLSRVTGLTAVLTGTTALVGWERSSGATLIADVEYRIDWATAEVGPWMMDIELQTPQNPNDPGLSFEHDNRTDGATYWYRIKALHTVDAVAVTESEWAIVSTDPSTQPAPEPVEGFAATAISNSLIRLSWTAVAGDISFEIEYNDEGSDAAENDWESAGDPPVSSTQHDHDGLLAETQYWYRIRAKDQPTQKTGDWTTEEVTATTGEDPTETGAVRSLKAEPEGTSVELTWTAPSGSFEIDHYLIHFSKDNASWSEAGTSTRRSYTHTDLGNGSYRYRVAAVDTDDERHPWSNTATARITGQAPSAPRNLDASASSAGVTLTWREPADPGGAAITGYRIEKSTDGGSAWTRLIQLTGAVIRTYVHTDAGAGQTIHYRVFAINKFGTSPSSNVARVVTARLLPTAPRNLTGQANASSNSLSWQMPSDKGSGEFTGYRIEQSIDGGIGWTELARVVGTATSYVHRDPPRGVTISYRVFAMNDNGDSPASNVLRLTTKAKPPTKPLGLVAYAEGRTVRLSWTEPGDDGGSAVTGYRVEVSAGSSNWRTVANTGSPETSYAHVGVEPGVTLHYRVYALNGVGEGPSSNIARVAIGAVAPDAPLGVGALAQSPNAIGIAWNPPVNTGGAPVTAYRLEFSTDAAFWSVLVSNLASTSTSYRHAGPEACYAVPLPYLRDQQGGS